MKLMITTAAMALMAVSAPAAAQNYGSTPPPPQRPETAPAQAAPAPTNKPTVKPSSRALKALVDLQTAVDHNDTANIPAKVAAAQAVASTKEDRYLIAEMQLKAAVNAKDKAAMASAIDAIAASGYQSPAEVSQLYLVLGNNLYNDNQFDQAAAVYQKGSALDPNNSDILINLGETKYKQGQKAEAAATLQRAIQAKLAAGQKPPEAVYKRTLAIAYEANSPSTLDLSRAWVAAYPSAESWQKSILVYRNQLTSQDVEGTLDLMRLLQAAGGLSVASDYKVFAEAAADQSNFNEAQAVVDAATAAHAIDSSDSEFRDVISGLKAKPKATPADLEAAAKTSPSAINLLRIGDRYYGMGDYAKAADTYRQVMAKPGADKDLANLHLGMALARSGDKAGATAAFNAVGGSRAPIAKLWLVYVQQHA